MKREFLTIANCLSILRAVLVIPFTLLMLLPAVPLRGWAAAVVLAGMVTDKLDGDIARARGEETSWGRILDPLADKVGVAVMALVLLALGDLPLWFVAALLARDALILGGGLYLRARKGIVLPSNMAGKVTVGAIAVTIFIALLGVLREIQWIFLALTLAGLLVSTALYARRFVQAAREGA